MNHHLLIVPLLLLTSLALAGCVTNSPDDARYQNWNLTLSWNDSEQHLTLAELKEMPSYTGEGYLVSTVGIRYGPFTGTGVPLSEIIRIMGGMDTGSRLYLYGSDGYLWVLDNIQVSGKGFITFDENLVEFPDQKVTPVLMYAQNNTQITEDEGGPIRLALLTNKPGVITEGSGWVKWISRIELHR